MSEKPPFGFFWLSPSFCSAIEPIGTLPLETSWPGILPPEPHKLLGLQECATTPGKLLFVKVTCTAGFQFCEALGIPMWSLEQWFSTIFPPQQI